MRTQEATQHKRWLRIGQLSTPFGLALLLVAIWMLGSHGAIPALADPGTLYVDGATGSDDSDCTTSTDPCATISYALTQAGSGDEVLVAKGTYTETLDIATVTLKGGYEAAGWTRDIAANPTIVDANGADSPVFTIHPDFYVTVEGFTIQGANHTSDYGGGFFINGSTVVISGTVIRDNSTDGSGGGGYVENSGTAEDVIVSLINSTIISNVASVGGGGIRVDAPGTSVVISNSQILSNTASGEGGGGIGVSQATLSMSNSSVMDNSAPNGQSGGIDVRSDSTVNVVDSIIADNSTRDHGGAATIGPTATLILTNTLITGNSTTSDNANVFAIDSQVTVMNSTISDNNPQGAQAVILFSGHLTITNSILWNNAFNLQGDPPCPTCFTVSYSDIEGGYTGTGNLDENPLFVDSTNSDYHLQFDSPSIDAGTNTGAPSQDLDSIPRPQDGDNDGTAITDMGAYEFRQYKIYLPLTLCE